MLRVENMHILHVSTKGIWITLLMKHMCVRENIDLPEHVQKYIYSLYRD